MTPADDRRLAQEILEERRFDGADLPRPFAGALEWLGDRPQPVADRLENRGGDVPGGPLGPVDGARRARDRGGRGDRERDDPPPRGGDRARAGRGARPTAPSATATGSAPSACASVPGCCGSTAGDEHFLELLVAAKAERS